MDCSDVLAIAVCPLRVDKLGEAPVVWLDNGQRAGTGAGRSAEGNDETAGDVEDEVPRFNLYFPSWRGLYRAPDRNTDEA
jgi:hypothetical protein